MQRIYLTIVLLCVCLFAVVSCEKVGSPQRSSESVSVGKASPAPSSPAEQMSPGSSVRADTKPTPSAVTDLGGLPSTAQPSGEGRHYRESSEIFTKSGPEGSAKSERGAEMISAHGGPFKGQIVKDSKDSTARLLHSVQPGEELWVINKAAPAPDQADDRPGSGSLEAKRMEDGKEQLVPVPLKHTDVTAKVAGYISSTTVTQQFHNPFPEKIEAIYVFPLPENAAINEFVMTIGSRKIRGIIREREEAEKIYQEARSQGYVASLLTQERPNIFTQSVANIEPGKQIDIQITYYHTMTYADGWYEWVFPMVVGPRYNPAGSTQGVGAAAMGKPGSTGQKTEVQYLKPTQRSGHDIALSVEVSCPAGLEEISSTSHQIDTRTLEANRVLISIKPADTMPNKDFVLRYRVAGEQVKSGLVLHRDSKGGYFSLMVYPPAEIPQYERESMEMVFLLDVSGSMSGAPMDQSKAAMRYALTHMDARDTFQVITFSGNNRVLFDRAQPVNKDSLKRAMNFIEDTSAGGGTEMLKGIAAALDGAAAEERRRVVVFLTDGFVGNEMEILRLTQEKLGSGRVFAFGVGSSPNRYLMDGLARVGRGAVAYVGLHDNGEEIMRQYFQRVSHPAMTDMQVSFGDGMKVSQMYPSSLPDLFVGRPVVLTGRFSGELPSEISIRGRIAGKPVVMMVPADKSKQDNPALAAVWARHRITDMSDRTSADAGEARDIEQEVKTTAIEYGLMSAFTAFIAVDSSAQTAGTHGTTVTVPVPMPEGVKYETTVKE